MAAPVVSGVAAVVRQYLRQERKVENPSAALLKAVLISATRPVPQRIDDAIKKIGFPDFDQGFGRIDISAIIPDVANPSPRRLVFADVANTSQDALESRAPVGGARKSTRVYKVTVAAGAKAPLVATLAWTDPPGNDLQNNLQLDVRGPADLFVIGNANHIFMKDPDFNDVAPNGVVLDKRNNVEQIRIDAAEPGEYLIRVSAHNTVLPPQGYALAVVGCVEGDLQSS
jgi:serine protease AprX